MNKIFLVPAKDVKVPYPGQPKVYLPANGAFVKENVYWTRRILEKSVVLSKPPKNEKTTSDNNKK